jgi:hypothetical protein
MANVDALVQEGIAAIKAGKRDDAKRALMKAVELDEQSEQGWLWLSACVDSPDEQQICLENVLAINPSNEKARKGLNVILQAAGKPPSVAPSAGRSAPTPPPAPNPDPFSGSFESNPFGASGNSFDSNPYAGTGFDSNPYGSTNDDLVLGSPSSVDWNTNTPSGGSAFGSGKQVDLPSSDEYDNWVSGLSLGGNEQPDPFDNSPFGSSGPFASPVDTGFDDVPDPFSGAAKASPFDMGSSGAASSPFGDFNLDDNSTMGGGSAFGSGPFGAPSEPEDDPFASPSSFGSNTNTQSAFTFGNTPKVTSPAERDTDDIFGNVPGKAKGPDSDPFGSRSSSSNIFGGSSAFGGSDFGVSDADDNKASSGSAFIDSGIAPGKQAYFKAIPPEIQASAPAGKTDPRQLAMVAVLALLNVISLAFLMINLAKH